MLLNKPPIKAIIFDFGKTIHDFNLDRFFNWLSLKFGISRHYFWDMFSCEGGLIYDYELGRNTEDFINDFKKQCHELLKNKGFNPPHPEFTHNEFLSHWCSVFDSSPLDMHLVDLFLRLKAGGYKLYICSNINKSHLEYLKGKEGHYSRFKEIFSIIERFIASCDHDMRCRKARDRDYWGKNRIFFEKVLNITNSLPGETIFIDDIREHVVSFRNLGGYGIYHTTGGWTKTESELYKLGVRW